MNISRTSWHYRFIAKFGSSSDRYNLRHGDKQHNTCSYIRVLLWTMIRCLAFSSWLLAVSLFILTFLCSAVYTAYVAITMGGLPPEPTIPLVMGTILWAVLSVLGIIYLLVKITNFCCNKVESVLKSSSIKRKVKKYQKSLMKQAMDDRKEGICTLVKFTD